MIVPTTLFPATATKNSLSLTASFLSIVTSGLLCGAWQSYLERSSAQRRADQSFFCAELKRNALSETKAPAESRGTRGIPLNGEVRWYSSSEATRIADNLLSFQTPAGGWSKNLDMVSQPRKPGQRFALGNLSRFPGALDFDSPNDPNWNYVGTFDNDATTTQLQFLARVIMASDKGARIRYERAFLNGLEYIFSGAL
jgi:hypothetical protein